MEKVKHGTDAEQSVKLYASPRVRVVIARAQGIFCLSPVEKYVIEMKEGDDNW